MNKNVAIVHYNTPELTAATIRSLWKNTPDAAVTVFDNSDRHRFRAMDGVRILDNTTGRLVDFGAMLGRYPDKIPTACNWGSEKHIASVDYLFDILPDGFVLMDSDVLVKKDITPFFDPSVSWVGAVEYQPKFWFQNIRCYPFLLWINVPMLRKSGIRFFHPGFVYKMSHQGPPYFDTGGSLYRDCHATGLPCREVDIWQYIEHLGGASCRTTEWKAWLKKHEELYM